jgi:putative phosphoesterase
MKLGVISDVHANLVALETVLEDMPPVDDLVCAGDVVGYNPWPAECVDLVRERCSVTVEGNHDRNVDSPERYRANRMAHAGLEYAAEHLDEDRAEWVRSLPRRAEVADGDVLMVHSHPADPGRYVRSHEFSRLGEFLEDYEGLVLGHTHVQHLERLAEGFVLNPGSVGQPRDRDPRAAYAVVDTDGWEVDLQRVAYDVDAVVEAVEAAGLPTRTAARLERGE